MKQKISIPENWNEILLSDYLNYYKRIKPYLNSNDEDLLNNVAIDNAVTQLCKVDYELFKQFDATDAIMVKTEVAKLLAKSTEIPLVRFFTMEIEGETIEFGFEPNLDEMSYGCYLDLAEASKDIWSNIWTFLATLYRPITTRVGDKYRIAEYEGTDMSLIPHFKKSLTADIALGSVFFFLRLQEELLTTTLSYTSKLMKKPSLLSRLRGKGYQANTADLAVLSHSLEMISQKSMLSPDLMSTLASSLSAISKNEMILKKPNTTE